MIIGGEENNELWKLLKHRGIGSTFMVYCMEDIPQAVVQLYIILLQRESETRTKTMTIINFVSSMMAICMGTTLTLLDLADQYYKADPKNGKIYIITKEEATLYSYGGGYVEESLVCILKAWGDWKQISGSVALATFSSVNICITVYIFSHVLVVKGVLFGSIFITLRFLAFYSVAIISWWASEGGKSFLHGLTFLSVMVSRLPILEKSHSLIGQKLYMILIIVDIPLTMVIYFMANEWYIFDKYRRTDQVFVVVNSIIFLICATFFLSISILKKRSIYPEDVTSQKDVSLSSGEDSVEVVLIEQVDVKSPQVEAGPIELVDVKSPQVEAGPFEPVDVKSPQSVV